MEKLKKQQVDEKINITEYIEKLTQKENIEKYYVSPSSGMLTTIISGYEDKNIDGDNITQEWLL
jgi:hypothetical protein